MASNNNKKISTEQDLGNCSNPSKKKILDQAGTLRLPKCSRRMYSSSNSNNRRWHPTLMHLSTGAMLLAKAMLKRSSIKITALKNSNKIISSTTRSSSKSQFSHKISMLIIMQILEPQSTISKIRTINTCKNSPKRKTHKRIRKKQSRKYNLMMLVLIKMGSSRACSTSLVELPLIKAKTKLKQKTYPRSHHKKQSSL